VQEVVDEIRSRAKAKKRKGYFSFEPVGRGEFCYIYSQGSSNSFDCSFGIDSPISLQKEITQN